MSTWKSPGILSGVANLSSRVKLRRLVNLLLLFVLSTVSLATAQPQTAMATGEKFNWSGTDKIVASGGVIPEPATLTVSGGIASTYSIYLHSDSKTYCVVGLKITLSSDGKTGTTSTTTPSIASSPGGPTRSCTSTETAQIETWSSGATVSISPDASNAEETAAQRKINVVLDNPNKKSDSPKSVKFTLKKDGKEVKSFSSNIGDNGDYFGTFNNIDPGKYQVCVDKIDARCQNVTKEKYKFVTAFFGETASDQAIQVNFRFNVAPEDPGKDQTYGPYKVELRDKDGKVIKTKDVSFLYPACTGDMVCGGVVNLSQETKFSKVEPGDYEVCIEDKCVDAKKVKAEPLTVDFEFGEDEVGTGEGGTGSDEPVCSAGALGWVICPVINFIADINDSVYDVVENMLYIDPVTVEMNGPLYQTWTKFRDLANILFVIVFMIVIFSQATSVGLSNYGIKRILPRIFAAAVLVNISFFLCQIAIDLSNIAGIGVIDLVGSLRSGSQLDDIDVLSWSTAIAAAVGGAGVYAGVTVLAAPGGVAMAIGALAPFAVAALFAIVTALVVLIARQVLIILLIALAPLAFIAIILPNTQKYFQLWQNAFTTLLIMFPLVALLFAGSQLAANIILTSPTSGDGVSFFSIIAAVCMLFIPLFGVPYIVKFSGGTLGRIAGIVNNPNKGPLDSLKNRAENYKQLTRDRSVGSALSREGPSKNPFVRRARRAADREDKYARAKDSASRANQRYLAGKYSGESIGFDESKVAFDESAVDVSGARDATERRKIIDNARRATITAAKQKAQTNAGEQFARSQLGGQRYHSESNLQVELNRARAGAISQENEESRKRSSAIEQLYSQREQGLGLEETLAMYDTEYAKAVSAGDHETATAVLRKAYTKGGAGRSAFAKMVSTHKIEGVDAQKHMEEAIYSIANDNRADVVKGGMDNAKGTWSLAGAQGMSYEQITKLDDKAMYRALSTISPDQANHILGDDNLKSLIQTGTAKMLLEARAGQRTFDPNAKVDPSNPNSKTWHETLNEN